METLKNDLPRRDVLKRNMLSLGAIVMPLSQKARAEDDETLAQYEMKTITGIGARQYQSLWANLKGMADEVLSCKIHPEASTIR